MVAEDDIAMLRKQEEALVFERFDEDVAWSIGARVRARCAAEKLSLVCEIKLWDRRLFWCAMPGTRSHNWDWVQRKTEVVRMFGRSSYRAMLENNKGEKQLGPNWGRDPASYALSGGSFPINVRGVGVVGTITLSGMHERDDHQVGVDAICDELGLAKEAFALPAK